jgi:hypothetical protein
MSGSIYAAKEGVFHIQDNHFDKSMRLLGWLKNHIGMGVTTGTVKQEVSDRLRDRVIRRLDPAVSPEEHSVAYAQCLDRLNDFVARLKVERITDKRRFSQRLSDVVILYGILTGRASRRSGDIGTRVRDSISGMPGYLRGVASDIRREQFWKESVQLMRLRNRSLSEKDQRILAEAACLYEAYNCQEPTRLLLASTDLLIAPVLNEDDSIKSDTITSALRDKFHIECDWPQRIARHLQSVYPDT